MGLREWLAKTKEQVSRDKGHIVGHLYSTHDQEGNEGNEEKKKETLQDSKQIAV